MKTGETANVVAILAIANRSTQLDEVRSQFDRVPDALTRVRGLLAKGRATDAWENFLAGYIRFHLEEARYQLSEILPELQL